MRKVWLIGIGAVVTAGVLGRAWVLGYLAPRPVDHAAVVARAQAEADTARAAVLQRPDDWEANRTLLVKLLSLRDRRHVQTHGQGDPQPARYGDNTAEIEALLLRLERQARTPEQLARLGPLRGWAERAGGGASFED